MKGYIFQQQIGGESLAAGRNKCRLWEYVRRLPPQVLCGVAQRNGNTFLLTSMINMLEAYVRRNAHSAVVDFHLNVSSAPSWPGTNNWWPTTSLFYQQFDSKGLQEGASRVRSWVHTVFPVTLASLWHRSDANLLSRGSVNGRHNRYRSLCRRCPRNWGHLTPRDVTGYSVRHISGVIQLKWAGGRGRGAGY
jgi:hypothetical protein